MPALSSLLITLVEIKHSARYIANTFARKELATVSHILLIPYSVILKDRKARGSMAIIYIKEWHDTESAWGFIRDLNTPDIAVKMLHDAKYETAWSVFRNPNPTLIDRPDYIQYLIDFEEDALANLVNDFEQDLNNSPTRKFYNERYDVFTLEVESASTSEEDDYSMFSHEIDIEWDHIEACI